MSKDTLSLQDKGAGCSENVISAARRGAETRAQGHMVPVLGCDPAMAGLGQGTAHPTPGMPRTQSGVPPGLQTTGPWQREALRGIQAEGKGPSWPGSSRAAGGLPTVTLGLDWHSSWSPRK